MYTYDKSANAEVLARLSVSTKDELLDILCRRSAELPHAQDSKIDYSTIHDAITAREKQASTAIGNGIVLPHARLNGLEEITVIIATLAKPLPTDHQDNTPISLACMLLIPASKPMEGLKFIARFARFASLAEAREKILQAESPEEMREHLVQLKESSQKTVFAGDIMAKQFIALTPEMPLRQATSLMNANHSPILPVCVEGKLVGQISCNKLFTLGIPDFFTQLKSVGFIRYFDPFESYFSVEANSCVNEVMERDFCTFCEDATLIEVVFAISILKYQQVYVVDKDGRLLGIIDQALLLERIINL